MKIRALFFLSVGAVLFISGCLNLDDSISYKNGKGVVLSDGKPVSDAEIHIKNYYSPGGFIETKEYSKGFEVNFSTSTTMEFTGNLYRYKADTLLATFLEREFEAGQHKVYIPSNLLSNGIFSYEIINQIKRGISSLIFIQRPDSLLPTTAPFTTTDNEGMFTLDSDVLAFGDEFLSGTGGAFKVTDSLQIFVILGDSIATTKRVRFKPNKNNFFEISID